LERGKEPKGILIGQRKFKEGVQKNSRGGGSLWAESRSQRYGIFVL